MRESIEEKLDKLNPNAYASRDAAYIRSWKERLPKLLAQKDYLNHPITRDLKDAIRTRIREIDGELANNIRLTNEERLAFFGEKNAHKFYLDALSQDPEGEITVIEQAVNMELQ